MFRAHGMKVGEGRSKAKSFREYRLYEEMPHVWTSREVVGKLSRPETNPTCDKGTAYGDDLSRGLVEYSQSLIHCVDQLLPTCIGDLALGVRYQAPPICNLGTNIGNLFALFLDGSS